MKKGGGVGVEVQVHHSQPQHLMMVGGHLHT